MAAQRSLGLATNCSLPLTTASLGPTVSTATLARRDDER
jgi:hypothetical protein